MRRRPGGADRHAQQTGFAAWLAALVALILLGSPIWAFAQDKDKAKDENKVSNDDPARPFQLPPATPEVKEALDDFDRFGRRGAWERALKSLYSIPAAQSARFIDSDDGFVIPVSSRRRSLLAGLSADGMAAYKTFYDVEAKKILDEADGPNQLADLEKVYSSYFSTTVGDNAADRLGDLYYELGRFDRAADCWQAILRDRPDTDLSLAQVSLKAALALHRAGRSGEFDQVRADLRAKHDDEVVTIGGRTGKPTEVLGQLIAEDSPGTPVTSPTAKAPSDDPTPEIGGEVLPAWQFRFADSIEAGQTPLERTQWDSNGLSIAVPSVAAGGSSLFVNYLGFAFALDAKTGKMLWRSGSFHTLDVLAMQQQAMMIEPRHYAVVASDEFAWFVSRDVRDQNFMAPFRLSCRRASNGDVVWKSDDLGDYAPFDIQGVPYLVDGRLYVIAKSLPNPNEQNLAKQFVLSIRPEDGKLLWKAEIGTFRQAQQMYYYYYQKDDGPQPRLIFQSGSIYVDTSVGVLARLDAESGSLEWGYGYRTDMVQGEDRFFFYRMQQSEPTTASAPPLRLGDALLIKGAKSDQIQAVDPNRMKVLWGRPISKSSRMLGTDGKTLFLGGPELSALDLESKQLLWATRIPGGSLESRVLVRPDGIWQLTPRGVFEVDPKSGDVRRIFRGNDLGVAGGDLYLTDRWLVSVSNRTITAYPRRAGAAEGAGATKPRVSNE